MSDKSKKEDRGFLYSLADNLVGFDDGYDTPGEKLGKVVNKTITDPVGTGKALATGIKNEMEDVLAGPVAYAKTDRPVLPDGTVELKESEARDYFNSMLGLSAVPLAPGGKSLFTRDPNKVNTFIGNKATDPERIRGGIQETPRTEGPGNEMRWEIPDNEAISIPKNLEKTGKADLADIFIHDELYYQYPWLKNVEVSLEPDRVGAAFYPSTGSIGVGKSYLKDPKLFKRVLLHETAHAIQLEEGWDFGANSRSNVTQQAERYLAKTPENQKLWKDYLNEKHEFTKPQGKLDQFIIKHIDNLRKRRDNPSPEEHLPPGMLNDDILKWEGRLLNGYEPPEALTDLYLNTKHPYDFQEFGEALGMPTKPRLANPSVLPKADEMSISRHEAYRGNSGEVNARNTEARSDMTLEELRSTPPHETQDVPDWMIWKGPSKYAKGGTVMEEVDPVSGNEVPAGALPEEVRDDVDAKLSEGEYVIPANVVRYYGIAHFEKQIDKASQALEELSAKGRIGGEKGTPPPMPEDDLPFTDEELMAGEVEMNEGGLVPDTFDPSDFVSGFSTFNTNPYDQSGGSDKGIKNKIYIGPDGRRRVVMYIDGIPLSHVPDGYVEDTPENRAARETKEAPDTPLKEGGRTGAENDADMNSYDPSGRTPDQLGKDVARAGKFGAFAGMLGGPGVAKAGSELSKAGTLEAIATDRNISIEEAKDLTNSKLSGFMSRQAQKNIDRNKSDSSFDVSFDPDRGVYSADGIEVSKDLMDSVQSAVDAPAPSAPSPSAPSAPDPSPDGDDGDDGDNGYGGVGNDAYGYMNKGGLVTRNTTKKKSRRVVPKGKGLATRK